PRSGQAVYLMHVAAGHAKRGVVLADSLLVRAFEQAVDLALGVVVQLDLAHAKVIGPLVAGSGGGPRGRLRGQAGGVVEIHESRHVVAPSGGWPAASGRWSGVHRPGRPGTALEQRWHERRMRPRR